MAEVQRRLGRVERVLGETLSVPRNERVQVVNIPFNDGTLFEKEKAARLNGLHHQYGDFVESCITWVGVVSFRTAGTETDPTSI